MDPTNHFTDSIRKPDKEPLGMLHLWILPTAMLHAPLLYTLPTTYGQLSVHTLMVARGAFIDSYEHTQKASLTLHDLEKATKSI